MVLAGIKAPVPARAARPGQKATSAEPCAAESVRFSYLRIMQREVELQIESMDNRGSIIGSITYKDKGNKCDLAAQVYVTYTTQLVQLTFFSF